MPSEAPTSTNAHVEVFEDVFDPTFCMFLLKDAQAKLAAGYEFSRSNYQWSSRIVRASLPVLVRDYDSSLSAIILGQLIERGVVHTTDYVVMNYAWSRLSYIPWHNDGMHEVAITVYLNEIWDRDWGGLFLYMDDRQEIKGYCPKFNTCVKNSGHILHSTTMIAPDASAPRLTLQIFPKGSHS